MKFKADDILYYVCPFSCHIDKVKVEYAVKEIDGIYYITPFGDYLTEKCLCKTLKEAKDLALCFLNDFYKIVYGEIKKSNPELEDYTQSLEDE